MRSVFATAAVLLRGAVLVHLGRGQQAGVVVLVALERQAKTLDGVGDEEARRVVMAGPLEGLQHDSYVASWLKVLKGDKRAIFTASSQAKKAAEFLMASAEAEEALAA